MLYYKIICSVDNLAAVTPLTKSGTTYFLFTWELQASLYRFCTLIFIVPNNLIYTAAHWHIAKEVINSNIFGQDIFLISFVFRDEHVCQ